VRTPNPPVTTSATRTPLPATATRTPLPVTGTITAIDPVRHQPPVLSAADVRAIVGDVTGAAVSILRTECENLSARLAQVEERLAVAERTAQAAATRPQQTTLVGTGPMIQAQPAPPPMPAPAPAPVPAAVAQVAPAFAAAAAVAPASVSMAAAAAPVAAVAPAPAVARPRPADIQFDLTPDDTDLPFATGASRQRRVLLTVLFILLLGVGAAVVSAMVRPANYVH
jgi:translation initiation factor IF-2